MANAPTIEDVAAVRVEKHGTGEMPIDALLALYQPYVDAAFDTPRQDE